MSNITIKQVCNFLYALSKHIYFGFKKSSKEQISKRYGVCLTCQSVHPNKNQCLECGCFISSEQKFFNKLAWLDQKCPLDKW